MKSSVFTLLILLFSLSGWNQHADKTRLSVEILRMDSLVFEAGFNQCEIEQFNQILSDDFEFVHDQGGIQDKAAFLEAFEHHICADEDFKPLRAAIEDSFEVFPLYRDGVLYGAIQNGVHEFFIREKNKDIYKTNVAKFSHLWLLNDEQWTLSRVLSYDHQAPAEDDMANVQHALTISTEYLLKALNHDGSFVYRVNTDPSISVRRKYNVLRHAGTIFALCAQYKNNPSPILIEAIQRAGLFLQSETIDPVPGKPALSAIWSLPEMNNSGQAKQAKLGGTGLGIVALLSIEEIYPGFSDPETLQALGDFLIYMQKEDGSFFSKYIPSQGGYQADWESLFYPGEAALGLAMLYEFDGHQKWLDAANSALSYLANKRKDQTDVPADHWALIATECLMNLNLEHGTLVSRSLLTNHAIQVCEAILGGMKSSSTQFSKGFVADGRTTPTSTRLEGLIAARKFLDVNEHSELISNIDLAIRQGLEFLITAQIKKGLYSGGVPRAISHLDHKDSTFNERVTEVRIDYVQHFMSALNGWVDLQQLNQHE